MLAFAMLAHLPLNRKLLASRASTRWPGPFVSRMSFPRCGSGGSSLALLCMPCPGLSCCVFWDEFCRMYLYFIGLYFEWNGMIIYFSLCCCDVVLVRVLYYMCSRRHVLSSQCETPVGAPWLVRRLRPSVTPPTLRTTATSRTHTDTYVLYISFFIYPPATAFCQFTLLGFNFTINCLCLSVRPSGEFMPHGQNFTCRRYWPSLGFLCGAGAGAWRR